MYIRGFARFGESPPAMPVNAVRCMRYVVLFQGVRAMFRHVLNALLNVPSTLYTRLAPRIDARAIGERLRACGVSVSESLEGNEALEGAEGAAANMPRASIPAWHRLVDLKFVVREWLPSKQVLLSR